jgi:23S rRNA (adenine2503-C2)-methyltransferase
MEIFKRVKVPTGHILVVDGSVGLLELISVGDYGKDINIKCDAMDLSREPSPVRHTDLLPLEKKWVITISTQFGCSMNCNFCDVPLVGPGKNASVNDMIGQVMAGISLHPEVKETERLNVHFARM